MRKLLLACILFISYFTTRAQAPVSYGNEWIDPTRVHYKISVPSDGIYHIPYTTLASTIPNFGSLNPANLVMYHNGAKVPIYVSTNSTFGTNDYIEFYGQHNTGQIDSLLYRSASQQIDPFYSLFSDNSIYYLTTNGLPNNPRLTMVSNDLTNLPVPEPYFMYFSRLNYPCGQYYQGKYYYVSGDELYKSLYEDGEGYTTCSYFNQGSTQSWTLSTPYVYTQGPGAKFLSYFANNSPGEAHNVTITMNGNTIYTEPNSPFSFQLNRVNVTVPASQLTSGDNAVGFTENKGSPSSSGSVQQNIMGALAITYPRTFTFDGTNQFYFQLAADQAAAKYLEITNFGSDNTQPLLYDLTNGLIYPSTQPNGSAVLKFHLQSSLKDREMFLRANESATFTTVNQLTPVNFIDYTNTINQSEYYIITNSSLLNDGSGNNWVEEYRKYRDKNENPGAGKYLQARIVDVDVLYDQFGYGIRKSPLGIRNFIRYAHDTFTIKPNYVFLIGKGREAEDMRSNTSAAYTQCLVPTFGVPGSDNLLAATRYVDTPLVAIGRLAAQTPQQVRDYLDKIKTYELAQNTYSPNQNIEDKIWQKQVLHFSGGTGYVEQATFKAYVDGYKKVAVDTSWGANVTSYSKQTDQPIDQSLSQIIVNRINAGTSWLTFFGHAATGAFDFSIGEPENYTNYGKYPIIISNGCFSGDIHEAGIGYSERFVLEAGKGAIAFMATSGLSEADGLNVFTGKLYNNYCRATYNKSLGKSVQKTIGDLWRCCTGNDFDMMTAYSMTLHGDPGMFVDQYPKPDYAIDQTSVFFTPTTVVPGTDSFTVSVVVTNLGKAVNDSIAVTLTRNIFDSHGNAVPPFIYRQVIPGPYYIDTVNFRLPVNISNLGYGQNLFSPYVDADFKIDEMAEGNNGLTNAVAINIQSDDIIPIYPYEFAIVPKQAVTLKASTINPFATPRYYKFQIDTSQLFNNPLQTGRIYQGGGVVHWTPSLIYKDSTVYYWRVAKDTGNATWHNSSFIYLNNEFPGWNQSHYYQYLQDDLLQLQLGTDRVFRYPPSTNTIHVRTGVANAVGGNVDYETLGWDYNSYDTYRFRMGGCGYYNGGLTFAVIDTVSGTPLGSNNLNGDNYGDNFGNVHCYYQPSPQYGFDFSTTGTNGLYNTSWSQTIKRFIDSIPGGSYVLIYSVNNPFYTSWDTTLVQALQSLGLQAQQFKNGTIHGPFTFFTQKNNINYSPFFAYKNNVGSTQAILDTSFTFSGKWFQGAMTSPKIGPAESWGSVHWRRQAFNNQPTDADTLFIIGERTNGTDSVLLATTQNDNIINNINATTFPYLKLNMRTVDDSLRTPTQLLYWRVLYKKPPEAAINPAAYFSISDSISIGQPFEVKIALENVTDVPMDSMLTKYTLRDASFHTYNYTQRSSPLPGLDTAILDFKVAIGSPSFNGLDDLIIEANPNNDQPEQYHFNNIAEVSFHGKGDKINPLLDVTFDAQHIMNGDIVSAKPDILVTLRDENKFLALNDSSVMDIYLVYPNQTSGVRIPYDGQTLKFYPADSTNLAKGNKAQAEFKPNLTVDGTYKLRVRDKDRSGNNSSHTTTQVDASGQFYDYEIDFEVINKPMITNVLNYPNPFTSSTKFIFTITGSEVPDFMKIQIMTIKGTVVREIMKEELGPLHIGTNITEYAWDGRDQYGDALANGVYFYHVITRLDNKNMDHMGAQNSNANSPGFDKYFKKGFGKMVLIR